MYLSCSWCGVSVCEYQMWKTVSSDKYMNQKQNYLEPKFFKDDLILFLELTKL